MNRLFLFFCILLFGLTLSYGLGINEKETAKEPEIEYTVVQVTGVVRLVGSSPLHELVISGDEAQWYVAMEDREKLHNLQHRTVTVEGEEAVRELRFASGISAGIRRDLRNIKIIEIH